MPVINNQIEYPRSGEYSGTTIVSPAKLPDPAAPEQLVPNITKPVGSTFGSGEGETQQNNTIPTNNIGFGQVAVSGQTTVNATKYMDTLTVQAGNNITLTTNAASKTLIISSTDTGIVGVIAGASIAVANNTGNNTVTVTNTMTETVYSGGNASGTLTPDRNNGTIQKFTLTGNITLNTPSNMSAGQSLTLILTQDSTGNRLLDANVAYLFASGFQTLSTASGSIDMLNIFSDGTTYYGTLTVGYA